MSNIKVVVRCRPLNARELARDAPCLVRMEGNKTILSRPNAKTSEDIKAFTFDRSYWSADIHADDYADQHAVYNDLGRELLDHAFLGYNCCIVAYGQTGSGKSYSMMGYGEDKGIIPRTCSELFERVHRQPALSFQVEVSYIEIYNEKVRDLLNPRNKGNLKVREHPSLGPYVEDLSRLVVNSFEDIDHLMDVGNKARTVAATNMNETSSRSHAVFTIFLTQKRTDETTGQKTERVARISLVDLAGSERPNSTGATGVRLKEGANINKSLTTLGKVIAGLAEQETHEGKRGSRKPKEAFIPYRDSVLTWLLKDSLGGNSKTAMIAAISPADFDETLSTLRYADQAKKIKTKAFVNEDPNVRMIRELKDEVQALKQALVLYAPDQAEMIIAQSHHNEKKTTKKPATAPASPTLKCTPSQSIVFLDASGNASQLTKQEMVDRLQSTEKLLNELNQTWEEKMEKTKEIQDEREKALEELGITVAKGDMGVYMPRKMPHLVNLNEDPLMSECLMYQIKPGITHVGTTEHSKDACIRLSGSNILEEHCFFENVSNRVTLYPHEGSITMVNGARIFEPRQLKSGFRIILGDYHIFRFNNPEEARKEREHFIQRTSPTPVAPSCEDDLLFSCTLPLSDDSRPNSPSSNGFALDELADWRFARREAVMNSSYAESTTSTNSSGAHVPSGHTSEPTAQKPVDMVRRMRQRHASSESTLSHRTSSSSYRLSTLSTVSTLQDDAQDPSVTLTERTPFGAADKEDMLQHAREAMERHLAEQTSSYEQRLKRLSLRLSTPNETPMASPTLSFRVVHSMLLQRVLTQWKSQRFVIMADTLLRHAALLHRANMAAARLDKRVAYQFEVVHDTTSVTALSRWESQTVDVDPLLVKARKPCVAVRMIDKMQQTTSLWSIEKLQTRQRHLEGLQLATDAVSHLCSGDLFRDQHPPQYALLGLARTSLRNLAYHIPVESTLDVYCRNTGKIVAKLTMMVAPIARSIARSREAESVTEPADAGSLLHVGQQLIFEVRMLTLQGVDDTYYKDVHVQFRLSEFGDKQDHVVSTERATNGGAHIDLNHHQMLSMTLTHEVLDAILHKDLTFEVFGQPQPLQLDTLWPEKSLNLPTSDHTVSSLAVADGSAKIEIAAAMTHAGLLPTSTSDMVASIQILELTSEGTYKPVPVEPCRSGGDDARIFALRQGQQRRIVLKLEPDVIHTEAATLWHTAISDMMVSHVRLVDADRVEVDMTREARDGPVHLTPQQQGTSTIQAAWDSSLHESPLLNRATDPECHVLLTLSWRAHAMDFRTHLRVRIHPRESPALQTPASDLKRRSSLFKFFASSKERHQTCHKTHTVFRVYLRPAVVQATDLWRLNSLANKDPTDPLHGLALIHDYREGRQRMLTRESVAATRFTVSLMDPLTKRKECARGHPATKTRDDPPASVADRDILIRRILSLWTSKPGSHQEIPLCEYPPDAIAMESPPLYRVASEAHQVIPSNRIPVSSLLKRYLPPTDGHQEAQWTELWAVLQRPYLLLYEDPSEANLLDFVHIQSMHVDPSVDTRQQVSLAFTLHTPCGHSHRFQAPSHAALKSWVDHTEH